MQILDITGRVLERRRSWESSGTIDLSSLRADIYLLRLRGERLDLVRRIVKTD